MANALTARSVKYATSAPISCTFKAPQRPPLAQLTAVRVLTRRCIPHGTARLEESSTTR